MNIFLLEDDEAIGIGLVYSLQNEGYTVTHAKTVKEATKIIAEKTFSLYLLDLTLPDGSGYDVCKQIKEMGDLPVIFLTAYDDEVNVVMGFDLGADDYISKPFRLKELTARIKSVLRRYNKETADGIIKIKDITINTTSAKVSKAGEEIILTAMDYRLLLLSDHKTLMSTRTHDGDPVPYLIYDSTKHVACGRTYCEASGEQGPYVDRGTELMSMLFQA